MATITLTKIEKSFGSTKVLKSIDLAIQNGEFLTLVGPSGCGKSTLLRILAGLEPETSGDISIDDQQVNQVKAADRNLAMVFQSYALYPHLTVFENMMTPLKLRDLNFSQRLPFIGPIFARKAHQVLHEQVKQTAATLKIEPLLDRKPGQLSGGQRQRVALGRAMVRKPVAFLMDEPLSNLDAALRVHMRSELSQLHRALGTTFIYVTHDQAEALTMSSRMAVMMDGEILQLDRPDVIYSDPADIRVAEFIGSPKINLLPAEADTSGRVSCLGRPLDCSVSGQHCGQLRVGIRPEHLDLAAQSSEADLSGILIHRENLGCDVYLHIQLQEGYPSIIIRSSPQKALNLHIGQKVHIAKPTSDALIFDALGKRIQLVDTKTDADRIALSQRLIA